MLLKSKTCCFAGHRVLPKDKILEIQERVEKEIIKLIEKGVIYFGVGGALGFDTIAELTILKLKKLYPQIKLILVLPCNHQTYHWSELDIFIYNYILSQSDKIVYTSKVYYNGCMQKRNRHLIENSKYCICYLEYKNSGTFYTVNYAHKKGLEIININF